MIKIELNNLITKFLALKLVNVWSSGYEIVKFFEKINHTLIDYNDVQKSGYCGISKKSFIEKYISIFHDHFNKNEFLENHLLNPILFVQNKDLLYAILSDLNKLLVFQNLSIHLLNNETMVRVRDIYFSKEFDTKMTSTFSGKDIKNEILTQLKKAKVMIWVQMAWLTDNDILSTLKNKENDGVDVKIIVDNNERNNMSLMDINFNQIWFFKGTSKYQMMHRKIYIIDLNVVLLGSSNATYNSINNVENMGTIIDREEAMTHAIEFLKLKKIIEN